MPEGFPAPKPEEDRIYDDPNRHLGPLPGSANELCMSPKVLKRLVKLETILP